MKIKVTLFLIINAVVVAALLSDNLTIILSTLAFLGLAGFEYALADLIFKK